MPSQSRKRRSGAAELINTIRGFQDSTTTAIMRVTTRATEAESSNRQLMLALMDRVTRIEEEHLEIERERLNVERQRLQNESRALTIMEKMLDFCNRNNQSK